MSFSSFIISYSKIVNNDQDSLNNDIFIIDETSFFIVLNLVDNEIQMKSQNDANITKKSIRCRN